MNRSEGLLRARQLEVAREFERRARELRRAPTDPERCKTIGGLSPVTARCYRNGLDGLARTGILIPANGTARGFCRAEPNMAQAPHVGTIGDTAAAVHGVVVGLIREYNFATEGLR